MSAPAVAVSAWRQRIEAREEVRAVAFQLGAERFACDVELIEEVVFRPVPRALPDVPPEVLGVLHLRGELLPVLDLGALLGMPPRGNAVRVVLVASGVALPRLGLAADDVEDVVLIEPATLRPTPSGAARTTGVVAVAQRSDGLLALLDLAEILRERQPLAPEEQP